MPDYIWNATPGPIQDASVGSNWLPPGPPSAADNAVFNNPTAAACNFDITAVNEIRIDAEFDGLVFGNNVALAGLSSAVDGMIQATTTVELTFSGTAPHNSGKSHILLSGEGDPFDNATSRSNITFKIQASSTPHQLPCAHYPHLKLSQGDHAPNYVDGGSTDKEVRFLSLTVESTVSSFAPLASAPSSDDKALKWISDGGSSQFSVNIDTFDGGEAEWTFQGYAQGGTPFTVPTDGTGADFTFKKMVIDSTANGAGAIAKVSGGGILILQDLTINSGAILVGDDTLGSAIHLINRPRLKGSWSFHPIADGIYHHKSNYTLGVAHGGTGLQSLAAGRIPFGKDGLLMDSDANLTWDSAGNQLTVDGKLTVTGLIDPTGMVFTPQASNPESTNPQDTIWLNNEDGHLYRGDRDVESTVHFNVRNDEGATIPLGAPLYSKGEIGGSNRIKVGIADASDANKMPCIGIAMVEMNTTSTKDGNMILSGIFNENITITSVSEQDIIYVAPHGGTAPYLTITRPTATTHLVQNVGICVRQASANTSQAMVVSAIGRTNDTPNVSYLTVSAESTHPQSRRLVAGTNITLTDGGAGGDLTIAASGGGGGSGTVTSVGLSVPTGFTVSGSPVTTSGTLGLAFDTGYALPTSAKQTQWDTAYGWGDHGAAGYLTTESDPVFSASQAALITNAGSGQVITAPERALIGSALQVETDPIYSGSPAALITNAGSGDVITTAERTLLTRAKARITLTSNQAYSSGTTKVAVDNVVFDTASGWDATNKRWVAPRDGYYIIHGGVWFTAAPTSWFYVLIYVNGSYVLRHPSSNGYQPGIGGMVALNAGDYVEMYVNSNSSSRTIGANNALTWLDITEVV